MTLFIFWILLLLIFASAQPELLNMSSKSSCIKEVVSMFVIGQKCHNLSDQSKSDLALRMTNCLLTQMGKTQILCNNIKDCPQLKGETWNTFTTFYTHIDNLCHFYWEIGKSEKAQHLVEALVHSAENTEKTLNQNTQNTRQIINLQNTLKLQILASLTSQQQMKNIIDNSSSAIQSLTNNLEKSLSQIHQQIGTHYAVINKILVGVNQIIDSVFVIEQIFLAQVTSVKGILYFIVMIIFIIIGCLLNFRVRIRRNQCLTLIVVNFVLEYLASSFITLFISTNMFRLIFLVIMGVLVLSTRPMQQTRLQQMINKNLKTERMQRIIQKVMRQQMRLRLTNNQN